MNARELWERGVEGLGNPQSDQLLDQAVRLDDSQAPAYLQPRASHWHARALAFVRSLQDLPKALACLQRALELEPHMQEAWLDLGICRQRLGLTLPALEAFERAQALAPDDPRPCCYRAHLQLMAGQARQALASLNRDLLPPFGVALRGRALQLLLRPEEAFAAFHQAVRHEPTNQEFKKLLREALLQLPRSPAEGRVLAEIATDPQHWSPDLNDRIAPPERLSDLDQGSLDLLAACGHFAWLGRYVERYRDNPVNPVPLVWQAVQPYLDRGSYLALLARHVTSPEALLTATDDELGRALDDPSEGLLEFLVTHPRLPLRDRFLAAVPRERFYAYAQRLLKLAPETFKTPVLSLDLFRQLQLSRCLWGPRPPRAQRQGILEQGREYLRTPIQLDTDLTVWLVETFGPEVADQLAGVPCPNVRVLRAAAARLGPAVAPIARAALESHWDLGAKREAIRILGAVDRDGSAEQIARHLSQALERPGRDASEWLQIATDHAAALEDVLWRLVTGPDRALRESAARALSPLGDSLLPRLKRLLGERKAELREQALPVLQALDSPAARALLEAQLARERSEEMRDQILAALGAKWALERGFGRSQVEAWAARYRGQAAARWLKVEALPRLRWADSSPVAAERVAYLCYRLTRSPQDLEGAVLLAQLDCSQAGDFARALLEQFLAAGAPAQDRWALELSARLADEVGLSLLLEQVPRWAASRRLELARSALQALALSPRDQALAALDRLSRQYDSRYPSLGQASAQAFEEAARRASVSPDELADLVVPCLGLPCQREGLEISIGYDLRLAYRDLASSKLEAALPKRATPALRQEMTRLLPQLKLAVDSQAARLEALLKRQHRWPARRWRELFLGHPLLSALAPSLVWICQGQTFRVLEDVSLCTAQDDPLGQPTGPIGIVHPLELSEADLGAWRIHLAKHAVVPPFLQMDRPVYRPAPELATQACLSQWKGKRLNEGACRRRLERFGWRREETSSYLKTVEGVQAQLDLGDISGEEVWLGEVRLSSPVGDLPSILYSELIYELEKVAGAFLG